MNEPTIYIIDDDPSVRRGLSRLLQTTGMNIESFASASDFLNFEKIDGPSCIVLDIKMPDMTGPELQEELRNTESCIPIVFLSAYGDVPTTARVMKKGAVDFLTKPVDVNDLMKAIHLSLEKDRINRIQNIESTAIREKLKTLTLREHEVMTYIITGMLNKQIAGEMTISEETVKIHRRRVKQKLGIVSVAELVQLCYKVGIVPGKQKSKYSSEG
ncbi:MAG: response regulator [Bacteroidetes bacterium]|nr:response regulator [Bacteroidota bacterium]